ncbi:MAG: hypothetical protein HEP71_01125 [Roseivirga sp.]|nr:hypothetical protein [Roseivirga sp.]
MGYMGFGMRKEVYKRKPKKAFKKVKAAYTATPKEASQASYNASKAYQDIRFRPAYKRLWFWLILILAMASAVYLYLEDTVFSEARWQERIAQFEETGIADLYFEDQTTLDSLVNFVKQKQGKVAHIGTSYHGDMLLSIRSANYHTLSKGQRKEDHHKSRGMSVNEILEPEVIDGKLLYHINDYKKVYDLYWSYDLAVNNVRDVNTTFLAHLRTEYSVLDDMLRKATKTGYQLQELEHGVIANFRRLGRGYLFAFTDSPDSLNTRSKLTAITTGVYWADGPYGW